MQAQLHTEAALVLHCEGDRLLGVLSRPTSGAPVRDSGVLIIVGGPQYRAGSHRQFVSLARSLADAGYPVLRFDARGMGDSTGRSPGFEGQTPDVAVALDALCREAGVPRVLLWGLCDGASAALLYLHETTDARVAGLCLVNPWVRSVQSLARTHVRHYYRQRLLQASFWLKLLRGGVMLRALRDLAQNVRNARGSRAVADAALPYQDRMAAAWRAFRGPVQLVLSGKDLTAREFIEYTKSSAAWAGLVTGAKVSRLDLDDADHTFSGPGQQAALERHVLQWWQQGGHR